MKVLFVCSSWLAGHKVMVIGDLFLDEYVLGQASRLSREAPIPLLVCQKVISLSMICQLAQVASLPLLP